jgi:hypothetical protein
MHYFEEQNINMEIVHIVAQSYDGASVMSGHLNGVQAQVKSDIQQPYIHTVWRTDLI